MENDTSAGAYAETPKTIDFLENSFASNRVVSCQVATTDQEERDALYLVIFFNSLLAEVPHTNLNTTPCR
jgi:hypothetical protein